MLLIEAKDYNDMSRKAANIISAQVIMKPHAVLGLATGSTPVGAYKQLVEWYNKGDLDFANVTSVNLDEYKGLSPENDQSYRYFMKHQPVQSCQHQQRAHLRSERAGAGQRKSMRSLQRNHPQRRRH